MAQVLDNERMDTIEVESFDMLKASCGRRHGSIEVRQLNRVRVTFSSLIGGLPSET
jgi:hypothetical protein